MSIYIDDAYQFEKQYNDNLSELENCLMFQNQKSSTINEYLNNLQSLFKTNTETTDNKYLVQVLENFKNISLQIRDNKYAIKNAILSLKSIIDKYHNNISLESLKDEISQYNTDLNNLKLNINIETSDYNKFIINYNKNSFSLEKIFLLNTSQLPSDTITDNDTLTISEKSGKVFLPYLVDDLKEKMNVGKRSYDNIQELINKEYILPLSKYKNQTVSRFVEGYALMKRKENASFLESIDLGFEMAFNKSLNPAIITACKNLDELDTYLDFLEKDKTNEFKIFKINYELLPKTKEA